MDFSTHFKHLLLVFLITFTNINLIYSKTPHSAFKEYTIISKRNIFRPLWKTTEIKTTNQLNTKNIELIKKHEEEQKLINEQIEAQKILDDKKREILNTFTLTGIIESDGLQAVIQSKTSPNKTYFVKKDDFFENMKIVSIDESKGEVVIDVEGKITITLPMQ